ncbi:hypothetical protein U472_03060 [Orenia metallireducens]|uniref:BON domain-containing protein n=1 Tax=Orenia metallireducens TaxID=1413210 RepID=A0A1C0AAZ0_9FIRM|nr:BON domain-containing protein [Orenia metallireducens]OCL27553.1 hypothetical protein U472_03060 [Orenia metallireducens]
MKDDNSVVEDNNLQEIIDGDINLRPYALKVDVAGDHVTVTGIVDSLSEKEHAERIIKDAVGNKEVDMAISISTDGEINDKDVNMEVAEEIQLEPKLKGKVGVKSTKGVVHLLGNVENEELKQKAAKVAAKARGVTEVINEIKVDDEIDEDIFHSQVRNDHEE